jgi:polysaccharide export outer membrane protein
VQKNIHELLTKAGFVPNFQLELVAPKSKKAYMFIKDRETSIIPLANSKISIKDIIHDGIILENSMNGITVVKITRNNKVYKLTLEKILDSSTDDIWIQHNDQIEIEYLEYKSGQVFALSGAGNATIIKINPSRRESLANVLFEPNGALSNLNAKRSEIYLIRGQQPTIAYHLDGQDASKILVAAKTELRPNDIIYVADREIISLSRLLIEISPARILTGDVLNNNLITE